MACCKQNGEIQSRPPLKETSVASAKLKQLGRKKPTETTPLAEALKCQWLEFASDLALRKSLSDDQAMVYLSFFDAALTNRPFLTGDKVSAVDSTVYAAVVNILSKLSFYDKERIPHFGRWFSYFEALYGPENSKVVFSLTPLY